MKTAIVYYSQHHGNTKKLVDAIASQYEVELINVTENTNADLTNFDCIGFASGIYFSSFAKQLLTFAEKNLPENKAFNLSGETTFSDLYNMLRNARCCVANDSGIMHLAAALGVPGVAVFGPTDYRATGPVSDKWLIVYDKEPCAPCFKRVCPSGSRRCMEKLTAGEVIEALKKLNVM